MDGFWDYIWFLLWIFLFMAYLIVLFQVLTDLFRDRELSGWWKAVWVVFLIFVPMITALIYLIARGRGMAERNLHAARDAKTATDDYIKSVATVSPADQIASAKKLLDEGAITPEEFAHLKAKALS
ncbi:putative oligomerization/nucleic acid binding protein [Isoptericola jiangsuensis]|uniref:Putative oligomerization/nucleic acid binding protein n=1 Tax=Isoptericola jiangsuensis TaxID=548579 RepID=A0A2A9F2C9_9MICO|nr:SHOCT domain-containing protein [Isoptericola jiangsuensis]PFG44670.1 putative oligomerization/nucleic acid binding protein [Isoptericola jiangsuensis]